MSTPAAVLEVPETARTPPRRPRAPTGLGAGGKRLWREVLALYEMNPGELRILEESCRVVDVLDELREAGHGPEILREARLQREMLRKLLASLDLPDEDEPTLPSSRSTAARALAKARWHRRA
ncbi:MAG: terminase [Actinomycetota bacterium]